ncbi:MAG: hypothetical protein COY75_00160 [Nitrospirae bacterium CG_4_10_14_0_8_um_filter_41_23]|nr:hypothetical protein [Nitrospirota bacterium]OIP61215.1 MAG: hypothetical protein AUK38_01300 [Nitrospirae bacterium CG2_30_41_42]PIQ95027.1 MAG: hypothetical protein COV68_01395 [Nitrospirae bacterium CG11_big_fil_rev_8_21_14_0_20_41_14]PIV44681.1 MAG: hypothetical protein COS27_00990 [Nitrospirae bacterium CG02_land_8_20_14_3_00_41_53]PIW86821.1 MAG: hypothetical protein COZ94_08455 [Nitrospirae bacterium CG_4_8_14_3_um_filter_41_47]PIY87923.1 MAG: hypothetical protein COY75_00160 [Nitros
MDSLKDRVKDIEKEAITNALEESNWVMARAARKLGITERMIGYKIKKYAIKFYCNGFYVLFFNQQSLCGGA